ncbi:MAG: SRPBCC domain-containing protein [Marinilabiliales bacterium]|nr:MAG: SRPBCC domain-containing protein [Marinilabiliales bacterium]
MKHKFNLEYTINSSPNVLYKQLSTPSGLSEWFADDVNLKGNTFTFIWDGAEERAEMISQKENKYIRFRWLESDDQDAYFEFKIHQHELTGDVALEITDFADAEDADDARGLWDTQISRLKHTMGL